ncbi:TadE/TadG family type IV pilus assembly protein [Cellulomonas chitinilytica]|uniref:TadE/TadG family type IV pilus assembly protein n=1 Tax=Cellulomonas chitinilytica TaxID=398759 RepID=UPI001EF1AFDD|nr:TadE/TadG family type IV pilus assembly protein [Cellulomonas chitinilytica]
MDRLSSRVRRGPVDSGVVSLEMVVLVPALMVMMFLGMQAALVYHARTVAIAAAEEGARAAASQGASTADGRAAAVAFAGDAGVGMFTATAIDVERTAEIARVEVTGTSVSVVPGWTVLIAQSASAPVERITTG